MTDITAARRLVEDALAATQDVRPPELRIAAFERAFEYLWTGRGTPASDWGEVTGARELRRHLTALMEAIAKAPSIPGTGAHLLTDEIRIAADCAAEFLEGEKPAEAKPEDHYLAKTYEREPDDLPAPAVDNSGLR